MHFLIPENKREKEKYRELLVQKTKTESSGAITSDEKSIILTQQDKILKEHIEEMNIKERKIADLKNELKNLEKIINEFN